MIHVIVPHGNSADFLNATWSLSIRWD